MAGTAGSSSGAAAGLIAREIQYFPRSLIGYPPPSGGTSKNVQEYIRETLGRPPIPILRAVKGR